MAQRKLGRGLAALVTLSPADADGTARISEATRTAPETSVLSLSGRTLDDFVRREDLPPAEPPRAATPRAAAVPAAPAPLAPARIPADVLRPVPDARPVAAPAAVAPPAPPPSREPSPAVELPLDDAVLYLDEQVGGLVLPDVELE